MAGIANKKVTGVVLAGGKARRMGGQDKGLIEINGKAMIAYVIRTLKPQVREVVINANRNTELYAQFGYPVFSDYLTDFQGPLAGIAAAMDIVTTDYICTCPCDGPLIPHDLVSRLFNALQGHTGTISVAHDGSRLQPVYALISCTLRTSLRAYLTTGERKIDRWYARHQLTAVDFSDHKNSFMNVNTPADKVSLANVIEQA